MVKVTTTTTKKKNVNESFSFHHLLLISFITSPSRNHFPQPLSHTQLLRGKLLPVR